MILIFDTVFDLKLDLGDILLSSPDEFQLFFNNVETNDISCTKIKVIIYINYKCFNIIL